MFHTLMVVYLMFVCVLCILHLWNYGLLIEIRRSATAAKEVRSGSRHCHDRDRAMFESQLTDHSALLQISMTDQPTEAN